MSNASQNKMSDAHFAARLLIIGLTQTILLVVLLNIDCSIVQFVRD
jgi:hypothetical protein